MIKKSRRASWTFPYPTFGVRGMTSIGLLYWILVLFLEWLPSVLCDIVLCLCRRKQRYYQREFIAEFREPRIYRHTFVDLSLRSLLAENLARSSPSANFIIKMCGKDRRDYSPPVAALIATLRSRVLREHELLATYVNVCKHVRYLYRKAFGNEAFCIGVLFTFEDA